MPQSHQAGLLQHKGHQQQGSPGSQAALPRAGRGRPPLKAPLQGREEAKTIALGERSLRTRERKPHCETTSLHPDPVGTQPTSYSKGSLSEDCRPSPQPHQEHRGAKLENPAFTTANCKAGARPPGPIHQQLSWLGHSVPKPEASCDAFPSSPSLPLLSQATANTRA